MVTEVKIIIALVVLGMLGMGVYEWRHSLIEDGEQKIQAAVADTTAKAEAQRLHELAEQKIADIALIQLVEKTYASALADSNVAVDDLNGKLRAYAAASRRGLALPGDPATSAGPDDAPRISPSVEAAIEGVDRAAGHDGAKVTGLQNYITKECH